MCIRQDSLCLVLGIAEVKGIRGGEGMFLIVFESLSYSASFAYFITHDDRNWPLWGRLVNPINLTSLYWCYTNKQGYSSLPRIKLFGFLIACDDSMVVVLVTNGLYSLLNLP